MRRLIAAAMVFLVVLTTAADCEKSGGGGKSKSPPSVTSVTGELINSSKSKGSVTAYAKWNTSWSDPGPYGDGFEIEAGSGARVAGFCIPKNRIATGEVTNGFKFTFGFEMKGGDCRRVSNLDRVTVRLKTGKK